MSTFAGDRPRHGDRRPAVRAVARPAVVDRRRPHRRSRSPARSRACGIPAVPRPARPAALSINPFGEIWRAAPPALARSHAVDDDRSASRTSGSWARCCRWRCCSFGQHALHVGEAAIDAALHGARGRHRRGQPGRRAGCRATRSSSVSCRSDRSAWACSACGSLVAPPSFAQSGVALVLIGFFGGLFAVPLNALLQQRPSDDEKGRVLATNNVLNTVGILLASAALYAARRRRRPVRRRQIIVVAGVFTLVVEHLRARDAAGLLHPVLAVAAHAHDLPDQDRRPAEHPAARPGAASSRITCR